VSMYVNMGTIEVPDPATGIARTYTIYGQGAAGGGIGGPSLAANLAASWARTKARYFPTYAGPDPSLVAPAPPERSSKAPALSASTSAQASTNAQPPPASSPVVDAFAPAPSKNHKSRSKGSVG
jgi:hypothetical protein